MARRSRSERRARYASAALPALALGLVACAGGAEPGPRWIDLSGERVVVEALCGDGLAPEPGVPTEREVTVPAASVLRVRTALGAEAEIGGAARFRVLLDGEALLDHRALHAAGELPRDDAHVLPLPAGEHRLAFLVETDEPALAAAFLEPVIGPAEVGRYGARPWDDPDRAGRPDVVLFLADTFRADNLEAWGGAPEVAPHLNAIAARARCFLAARSPSVWTLPAHTSLFTGLFPLQHGALERNLAVAPEFETLAERFQAAGYRTGAVTDGVFLSRDYRMDQGFASFLEHDHRRHFLPRTLAAADAFLERDDGRPVFLFVHTYRVHAPYRVGAEEDRGPLDKLERQTGAALHGTQGQERAAMLKELALHHLALYRRGVSALDEAVGPWIEALETRGFTDRGLLVFTSDHGEEFLEHGRRRHGGRPHDEKTRVPLFLLGGGIEPGAVRHGASLTDLPPTLARLAGLTVDPRWIGADLLALEHERALFAYNGDRARDGYLAVVHGARKVFAHAATQALAEGRVDEAFDLERDPGEQEDLSGGDAPWPAELARRAAPQWEVLERELTRSMVTVEIDEAALEELEALGYVK